MRLLSLPREIGSHPETGKPISAGIGRYGPFVLHDGKYANLDSVDEVFSVGPNRAISLLAEKQGAAAGGGASAALKELGEHPAAGGAITVRSGRYGPYVNHGKLNATLPRNLKPEDVTVEQAVELLAAKESKAGSGEAPAKRARARKPTSARKPAAKKVSRKAAGSAK